MLSYLYRHLKNRHLRKTIMAVIARRDGGFAYSAKVRRLCRDVHGVEIGYGSYGGCFDMDKIPRGVSFGNWCSIADGVRIFRANHAVEKFTTHPILYNPAMGYVETDLLDRPPLYVGHDVWIGADAVILPRVKNVGNGAVIGAGSVVTKDVKAYDIVAGNPARVIGRRFDNDKTAALEASRWWELDKKALMARVKEFDALTY